jgi:S1-C subfamily serine protease
MPSLAVPLALALLALADPPDPLTALQDALTAAIAKAEPSVVAITRVRQPGVEATTAVRGGGPDAPAAAVPAGAVDVAGPADVDDLPLPGDYGSGVVIGPDGAILTAFHVVKGAARLVVRAPGRVAFDAEVLAADPRSDLAVIAPRRSPGLAAQRLTPLPLGSADGLRKGTFLIVLGNPYHTARDGSASASWGILANTARRIIPSLEGTQEDAFRARSMFQHQPTLLQLDTKLNLGLSGGAVVNLKGELVGITTTGGNVVGYDAQAGYAIPLDARGRRAVEALRAGKEVEYGFLGIRLDEGAPNVVGGVRPGTPAAEGDLVVGDEIVAVGDQPLTPEVGLSLALSTAPVGEPVRLKVLRAGREVEKTIFLSKYPVEGEVIATTRRPSWRGLRVDYTSVLAENTFTDDILQAMAKGGVAVVEVRPGTPAEAAGLRRGQIVIRVEGKAVRRPDDFTEAVRDAKGPVTLETDRGPVTVR